MTKLANSLKVSDEAIEDLPVFLGTVQNELAHAVKDSENDYGVSTILAASGLLTATGTSVIDATGAVLNPADLAAVRKAAPIKSITPQTRLTIMHPGLWPEV